MHRGQARAAGGSRHLGLLYHADFLMCLLRLAVDICAHWHGDGGGHCPAHVHSQQVDRFLLPFDVAGYDWLWALPWAWTTCEDVGAGTHWNANGWLFLPPTLTNHSPTEPHALSPKREHLFALLMKQGSR